jgi:adenylyltransferase/sulfurtransferase
MQSNDDAATRASVDAVKRRDARVLVVGVGGLGCPAALALAHAGVGMLGLADDDAVDRTNLHRQILFDDTDVGTSKLDAAARALGEVNAGVQLRIHRTRLLPANAADLVRGYDVVLEGSDNFATKFLTADACAIAGVPAVQAAAVRWVGTALAVGPRGGPCYRCIFEDVPRDDAPNCAEAGVMGPVVGIVGAIAADLALSLLEGGEAMGELVTFDGRTDEVRRRRAFARPDCPLCGNRSIRTIDAERYAAPACIE